MMKTIIDDIKYLYSYYRECNLKHLLEYNNGYFERAEYCLHLIDMFEKGYYDYQLMYEIKQLSKVAKSIMKIQPDVRYEFSPVRYNIAHV